MKQGLKRRYRDEDWRADAVAAAGEFVGTFMFLFLGLGAIQASAIAAGDSPSAAIVFAATGMAASLTFTAWSFFRYSGSCFNPCIALTLVLIKAIRPIRFIFYCVAQFAAAIAACAVLAGVLPGPLTIVCQLGNGTTVAQGVLIEMLLTCALCFAVVMSAVERHRATHLCAIAIGLALFSTQLFALSFTGAAVNSARAFGAAVIVGFDGYHWIYWVGPFAGAALAAGMYQLLLFAHFWELQPPESEIPASQALRHGFHDLPHDEKRSHSATVESV